MTIITGETVEAMQEARDLLPGYGTVIGAADLLLGDRWLHPMRVNGTPAKMHVVEFIEYRPAGRDQRTFLVATVIVLHSGESYDLILPRAAEVGPVVRAADRFDPRLPRMAVVRHPTLRGRNVLIRRGVMGFRIWTASETAAAAFNEQEGAQGADVQAAMENGATLGWLHPTARLGGERT